MFSVLAWGFKIFSNCKRLFSLFLCSIALVPLLFGLEEELHKQIEQNQQLELSIAQIDSLINQAKKSIQEEEFLSHAVEDLEVAFHYSQKLHYQNGIVEGCRVLGNYYLALSDNVNATKYFYRLMKEAEETQDTTLISDSHIRLGLVMYNMNKWQVALDNLRAAEKFISNRTINNNIKLITYLKGLCNIRLAHYSNAKDLLEQSVKWAKADGDSMRLFEARLALNNIALITNYSDEVHREYDAILAYFEANDEVVGVCFTKAGIARALLKQGNGDEAYSSALSALTIAKQLRLLYPISEILETLILAQKERGMFESAFAYQTELTELRDSVNNMDVAAEIAMLGAKHEFEKKAAEYDAELKANSRQRRFFLILFIATLFVALVIVFMLRLVAIQRQKSDDLLHNILPRQTVNELRKTGHSIPKAHTDVTIVFADVESFTKLASTLKPAVIVNMLGHYFGKFDAIITKHNLEKIKTIGDAYMFVSGLIPDARSAHQAAAACIEMIDAVNALKPQMEQEFGVSFDFRFGMHTGNVVSGVVGEIKYAFDIWGDAVNIASRMEASSESGRINISEDSYKIINDSYSCSPRGSFTIKNRGIVSMYYLDGPL